MRAFGRKVRNIGAITVGPVTQASAPNNSAIGHARPATR